MYAYDPWRSFSATGSWPSRDALCAMCRLHASAECGSTQYCDAVRFLCVKLCGGVNSPNVNDWRWSACAVSAASTRYLYCVCDCA